MPDPLLTPQDLADYCGVPIGTVYQWSSRGGGPTPVRCGRHLRFRPSDVDKWLEKNARPEHEAS